MTLRNSLTGGLAALCLAAGPVLAAETVSLRAFRSVEVDSGIKLTVVCGPKPQAEIALEPAAARNQLNVRVEAGIFKASFSGQPGIIGKREANITLTASGPLARVLAVAGTKVEVPACAVAPVFAYEGRAGSIGRLSGTVKSADITLQTGAVLEELPEKFKADAVTVEISTGSTAKLCHAKTAGGRVATGGVITLPATTPNTIDVRSGGTIERLGC